jgi:hypothetical protein
MEEDYIIYAKRMLYTDKLPKELENKLRAINSLIVTAKGGEGELRSSQIVALVVYDYFTRGSG